MVLVTGDATINRFSSQAGDLQLLQSLQQQGMSLDYHDPRKFMWTPLMAAVFARQSNVVTYLLEQGVDIEARDARGMTALMWAVDVAGTNVSIVQTLLSAGAKTNVTNNFGQTFSHAIKSKPEVAQLMKVHSQEPRGK